MNCEILKNEYCCLFSLKFWKSVSPHELEYIFIFFISRGDEEHAEKEG